MYVPYFFQFWDTNCDTVRNLVGPIIFQRIAKIFELPEDEKMYEPREETSMVIPSEQFYVDRSPVRMRTNLNIGESVYHCYVQIIVICGSQNKGQSSMCMSHVV